MESTNTQPASICDQQLSIASKHCDAEEFPSQEIATFVGLFVALEGSDKTDSVALDRHIRQLRLKRRSSAKDRRVVEDNFYWWLEGAFESESSHGTSFEEEHLPKPGEFDESQARQCAAWIVGVSDRRIREPILKRLHVMSAGLSDQERAEFMCRVQRRLMDLIQVAPSMETAALSSILALVAWQSGEQTLAQATVAFGRAQDQDNVLLRLVAGALKSGLPVSAWASVMDEYTLTQLRSG